jgi:hexosaminidase
LWNHFYGQVAAILRQQGLRASGWEELGSHRELQAGKPVLRPNPAFTHEGFTLYVWRNIDGAEDLAYRLANAGYDTVLAPATRLYLDMAYYPHPQEPGQSWAAYADLDAVYDFVPLGDIRNAPGDATPLPGKVALGAAGRQHVRGIEGTLFTETVRDQARLDYMLMPRLLAVAERAWAPDPDWAHAGDAATGARLHAAAWSRFLNVVGKRELPRLDAAHAGILYRIPAPGLLAGGDAVLVNEQLPGFTLRYTSDGSEPGGDSPEVSGPIAAHGSISVAAFDRQGRHSRSSRITVP